MHKHGTKTIPVFLPGTMQPEMLYPQGDRSGLRKPEKDEPQH